MLSTKELQRRRETLFARLMRHSTVTVVVKKLGACHLYQGPRTVTGYGKLSMRIPGRTNPVGCSTHVLAFRAAKGDIVKGNDVSHLCNQAGCWNPKHLVQESHAENIARKARRLSPQLEL